LIASVRDFENKSKWLSACEIPLHGLTMDDASSLVIDGSLALISFCLVSNDERTDLSGLISAVYLATIAAWILSSLSAC